MRESDKPCALLKIVSIWDKKAISIVGLKNLKPAQHVTDHFMLHMSLCSACLLEFNCENSIMDEISDHSSLTWQSYGLNSVSLPCQCIYWSPEPQYGASRFSSWWGPSSWSADSYHFTVCSCDLFFMCLKKEKKRACSGVSSSYYNSTNSIMRAPSIAPHSNYPPTRPISEQQIPQ